MLEVVVNVTLEHTAHAVDRALAALPVVLGLFALEKGPELRKLILQVTVGGDLQCSSSASASQIECLRT
jgi:hypothetical protein